MWFFHHGGLIYNDFSIFTFYKRNYFFETSFMKCYYNNPNVNRLQSEIDFSGKIPKLPEKYLPEKIKI